MTTHDELMKAVEILKITVVPIGGVGEHAEKCIWAIETLITAATRQAKVTQEVIDALEFYAETEEVDDGRIARKALALLNTTGEK